MESSPVIKLDEALLGVSLLGLDTAPFIYFVERNPLYLDVVREVFRRVQTDEFAACSSVVALTEVLVQPLQSSNKTLAAEYQNLLRNSRNFDLKKIDVATAERAAELRAKYRLRTPDAFQIAAAVEAGCEAFLCNDKGLRRVTEINVLILDEVEL